MSHWSVNDNATREWMKELYTSRFMRGMSVVKLMKEATIRVLQKRREKGGMPKI